MIYTEEEAYQRNNLDFKDYLIQHYDYIGCCDAVKIAKNLFALLLKDAIKAWKEVYTI